MSFSIHTIYRQLFKLWRRRRYDLFLRLLEPASTDLLLDVGGYPGFWIEHPPQPVRRIDTLNIYEIPWNDADAPGFNIRTLVGDGCALGMETQTYDIAFSNSVIEHVGSWEQQQQFASEVRRVAKALWVQTPAYECPIEPHYLTPFVHYLPRWLQKKILRWGTVYGWLSRPGKATVDELVDTTRLLRKSEMQQLFPDCEILTERMLWVIPKSYIAIKTRRGSV
jgi:hypothetical protein